MNIPCYSVARETRQVVQTTIIKMNHCRFLNISAEKFLQYFWSNKISDQLRGLCYRPTRRSFKFMCRQVVRFSAGEFRFRMKL